MATRAPGAPPSQQREVRVKRALANPVYFAEAFIAPYDPAWTEVLPQFAQDMLRFAVGLRPWPHEGGIVVTPPEHLKTVLLSQVLPLWLTARAATFGQLLRGMLLSEEEGMAQGNLAVISWHATQNERLAADFADSQGRPLLRPDEKIDVWREDAIVINRPGIVSRDPTWQAKGLDSKGIHGRRLDVVIGDDIVTPRNAESPTMRKRALDTIDLQVSTRIVAGGKFVIASNFLNAKDLPSTLAARPRWSSFRRPSMHRPGQPSIAPRESELADAQLTWPSVWTRERLMLEYQDKPNRFRRIHLLDPRAEHGERLNVGWVNLVTEEEGAALLKYARMFLSVDPAPGGDTEDLDFFAVTVGALTAGHLDVVQSFQVRADTPRQADLLGVMHDTYNRVGAGVVAIGISKVALDRYFSGAFKIKRPDLAHKLTPVSLHGDKETRLEALGPYAQSGWLRVWAPAWQRLTSDPQDQFQEVSLYEQWRDFPYTKDDALDALDVCVRTAQEFAIVGSVEYALRAAE